MKEKYLPIGTICQIKGNINRVMIKGYYGRTYNNVIKNYDYIGCKYPEGDLLSNGSLYFNHEDIINVVFNGYESDEFKVLNGILYSLEGDTSKIVKPKIDTDFIYRFDENGVVIFDGKSSLETSTKPVIEEAYTVSNKETEVPNPFLKNFDDIKVPKPNSNRDIFKKYTFDENGTVIDEEIIDNKNKESE